MNAYAARRADIFKSLEIKNFWFLQLFKGYSESAVSFFFLPTGIR